MKHIAAEEILSAVSTPVMTRQQKLERWADLVQKNQYVKLVHGLENWEWEMFHYSIKAMSITFHGTAFHIAVEDPVFKKMNIGDSINGVMQFFEISRKDLHDFTCDCGGSIRSRRMANRIRMIADPSWSGWFKRLWK